MTHNFLKCFHMGGKHEKVIQMGGNPKNSFQMNAKPEKEKKTRSTIPFQLGDNAESLFQMGPNKIYTTFFQNNKSQKIIFRKMLTIWFRMLKYSFLSL
jgi:hypothetical protein